MDNDIKPYPCCGSDNISIAEYDFADPEEDLRAVVECNECGLNIYLEGDMFNVAEAWNKRA